MGRPSKVINFYFSCPACSGEQYRTIPTDEFHWRIQCVQCKTSWTPNIEFIYPEDSNEKDE